MRAVNTVYNRKQLIINQIFMQFQSNIIKSISFPAIISKNFMSQKIQTKSTFIYEKFEPHLLSSIISLESVIIKQLQSQKSLYTQFGERKIESRFMKNSSGLGTNEDLNIIIKEIETSHQKNYKFCYKIKGNQDVYFSTYNFDRVDFEQLDKMLKIYENSRKDKTKNDFAIYRNIINFFAQRMKDFFYWQIKPFSPQVQQQLKQEIMKKYEQIMVFKKQQQTQKKLQQNQERISKGGDIRTRRLFDFTKSCVELLNIYKLQTFKEQNIIKLIELASVQNPILKALYKKKAFILELMRDFEGQPDLNQIEAFHDALISQSLKKEKYDNIKTLKLKNQNNRTKNLSIPKPNNSTMEAEPTQNQNALFQHGNKYDSDNVSQSISKQICVQPSSQHEGNSTLSWFNSSPKTHHLNTFSQSPKKEQMRNFDGKSNSKTFKQANHAMVGQQFEIQSLSKEKMVDENQNVNSTDSQNKQDSSLQMINEDVHQQKKNNDITKLSSHEQEKPKPKAEKMDTELPTDDSSQPISEFIGQELSPKNKVNFTLSWLNISTNVHQLNSFSQSDVDFVLSSGLNTNFEIILTQEKPNDYHEFQYTNDDQNIDVEKGSQYYCTALNLMSNIMVPQEETDKTFPQSQNSY